MKNITRLSLLGIAVALSACSVLENDKIDYKSAKKGVTLEVPPDLTQLSRDTRYNVPGASVSALELQAGQESITPPLEKAAALQVGDVSIERDGNQRWLVIDRPVDKIWDPLRDFWLESGFNMAIEKPELGIMETDWAENRAKLPQDFIRATLGKVLDSLYSTSERDRFRTRLERRADGKTEIYVTHRGMQEVYSTKEKDSTIWQPRAADPELETEFLRRIMVRLGSTEEQSKAIVASGGKVALTAQSARITSLNGQPAVQIDDGFDRAWRRVGVALDRTGFTVEDRDRSKGIYYVRYVPANPDTEEKKKGFFGRMFGSKAETRPAKFQISVRGEGNQSHVVVLNESGQPESDVNAQRIVRVITDDLK